MLTNFRQLFLGGNNGRKYVCACIHTVDFESTFPESAFLLVSAKNTDFGNFQSRKSANHGLPLVYASSEI